MNKTAKPPLHVVRLEAENLKRIVAVDIAPQGAVVEITGRNAQGKSSVLDALWWAITGTSHIQAVPIRKGADEAFIRLDLGVVKVIRTFRKARDGDGYTTKLVVENQDGSQFREPQTMLNALVGALAFDPLEFASQKPADQYDTLKRFVPGVDFDAMAEADKADVEIRRIAKKAATEARARADVPELKAVERHPDLPAKAIDEMALVDQLTAATGHNAQIEARRGARQTAVERIEGYRREAAAAALGKAPAMQRVRDFYQQQIDEIEEEMRRLAGRRDALAVCRTRESEEAGEQVDASAARLRAQADDLGAKLEAAGPLPDSVNVTELRDQIDAARATNALIAKRTERERFLIDERQHAEKAEAADVAIKRRAEERSTAIATAEMPVDGIGFGDRVVLLNGLPFDQASGAEQLRASIAIAMASNPRLKVLRVRQGSDLDDDSFRILSEMAAAADYQVWIESVQSGRDTAIVIEDGTVKAQVAGEAA